MWDEDVALSPNTLGVLKTCRPPKSLIYGSDARFAQAHVGFSGTKKKRRTARRQMSTDLIRDTAFRRQILCAGFRLPSWRWGLVSIAES